MAGSRILQLCLVSLTWAACFAIPYPLTNDERSTEIKAQYKSYSGFEAATHASFWDAPHGTNPTDRIAGKVPISHVRQPPVKDVSDLGGWQTADQVEQCEIDPMFDYSTDPNTPIFFEKATNTPGGLSPSFTNTNMPFSSAVHFCLHEPTCTAVLCSDYTSCIWGRFCASGDTNCVSLLGLSYGLDMTKVSIPCRRYSEFNGTASPHSHTACPNELWQLERQRSTTGTTLIRTDKETNTGWQQVLISTTLDINGGQGPVLYDYTAEPRKYNHTLKAEANELVLTYYRVSHTSESHLPIPDFNILLRDVETGLYHKANVKSTRDFEPTPAQFQGGRLREYIITMPHRTKGSFEVVWNPCMYINWNTVAAHFGNSTTNRTTDFLTIPTYQFSAHSVSFLQEMASRINYADLEVFKVEKLNQAIHVDFVTHGTSPAGFSAAAAWEPVACGQYDFMRGFYNPDYPDSPTTCGRLNTHVWSFLGANFCENAGGSNHFTPASGASVDGKPISDWDTYRGTCLILPGMRQGDVIPYSPTLTGPGLGDDFSGLLGGFFGWRTSTNPGGLGFMPLITDPSPLAQTRLRGNLVPGYLTMRLSAGGKPIEGMKLSWGVQCINNSPHSTTIAASWRVGTYEWDDLEESGEHFTRDFFSDYLGESQDTWRTGLPFAGYYRSPGDCTTCTIDGVLWDIAPESKYFSMELGIQGDEGLYGADNYPYLNSAPNKFVSITFYIDMEQTRENGVSASDLAPGGSSGDVCRITDVELIPTEMGGLATTFTGEDPEYPGANTTQVATSAGPAVHDGFGSHPHSVLPHYESESNWTTYRAGANSTGGYSMNRGYPHGAENILRTFDNAVQFGGSPRDYFDITMRPFTENVTRNYSDPDDYYNKMLPDSTWWYYRDVDITWDTKQALAISPGSDFTIILDVFPSKMQNPITETNNTDRNTFLPRQRIASDMVIFSAYDTVDNEEVALMVDVKSGAQSDYGLYLRNNGTNVPFISAIPYDEYTQIALVFTAANNTLELVLNGVLAETMTTSWLSTGGLADATGVFRFGKDARAPSSPYFFPSAGYDSFTGYMDSIKIYSIPLDVPSILSMYWTRDTIDAFELNLTVSLGFEVSKAGSTFFLWDRDPQDYLNASCYKESTGDYYPDCVLPTEGWSVACETVPRVPATNMPDLDPLLRYKMADDWQFNFWRLWGFTDDDVENIRIQETSPDGPAVGNEAPRPSRATWMSLITDGCQNVKTDAPLGNSGARHPHYLSIMSMDSRKLAMLAVEATTRPLDYTMSSEDILERLNAYKPTPHYADPAASDVPQNHFVAWKSPFRYEAEWHPSMPHIPMSTIIRPGHLWIGNFLCDGETADTSAFFMFANDVLTCSFSVVDMNGSPVAASNVPASAYKAQLYSGVASSQNWYDTLERADSMDRTNATIYGTISDLTVGADGYSFSFSYYAPSVVDKLSVNPYSKGGPTDGIKYQAYGHRLAVVDPGRKSWVGLGKYPYFGEQHVSSTNMTVTTGRNLEDWLFSKRIFLMPDSCRACEYKFSTTSSTGVVRKIYECTDPVSGMKGLKADVPTSHAMDGDITDGVDACFAPYQEAHASYDPATTHAHEYPECEVNLDADRPCYNPTLQCSNGDCESQETVCGTRANGYTIC